MNTKSFPKFLSISTYFTKYISTNFSLFRSRPRTYFNKFLSISRPQVAYFYKFLLISIFFYFTLCPSSFAQDPLNSKLKVEGETEISVGSLRLKPVKGSAPANPQVGDLYFSSNTLYTWDGSAWQTVSEEGDLFYNDADNSLYFYDGTEWQKLGGGGGPKAVATRIVAASDSLDTSRADYVCDGTDDQEEINDAINEVYNNPNNPGLGGSVYLLAGTYNITAPIQLKSNISLIGEGAGTVLKVDSSSNYNVINAQGTSTNHLSGILISQLRIDGDKDNVSGSNCGISFGYVDDSKITKIWIENLTSHGVSLQNSSCNILSKSFFIKNNSDGIYLSSSEDNIISKSNFSENGYAGIRLEPSDNNIIDSNIVYRNDDKGILLDSSSNNIILGNNISYTQDWHGLQLFSSSRFNIVYGNNINNNEKGFLINQSSTHNLISSNVITLSSSAFDYGIRVSQSGNNLLVGNSIYDEETNFASLSIANSSEVLIASNLISYPGNPDYGIEIDSASSDNYLAGNQVIDSDADAPGKIEDGGTETKYTQKEKMTLEARQFNISSSPYELDVTTSPRSFVKLNPDSDITLTFKDGKSAGDLLIVENISSNDITINEADSNINLKVPASTLHLGQYDTLELIWNGSKWIEVKRVDN